ncbi:MAG: four helix bundle protein [Chloroflexi bacterium]|nr:four helix bundle protein [Chloroflexota bacterium]
MMAIGDDLEERLIEFAVRIVKLCNAMPKTTVSRHLGNQLVRSGTSPAFNYGEARAAESKRDFVHKMRVVHKELNESNINLKIIHRSKLLSEKQLSSIMDECDQLCRIFNASIETALDDKSDKT